MYGGKQDDKEYDFGVKNGVYNDCYVYNIYRKTWKKQESNLDYRYAMTSANSGGRVYIFGGLNDTCYADANLIIMKITENGGSYSTRNVNNNNDN